MRAADGQVDGALAAADAVDRPTTGPATSTGIIAGIGRGPRPRAAAATTRRRSAAFDQVRAAADATEDRVAAAVTRLADAMAASARGEADAAERAEEADRRLAELGLADTGWRRAFSLALGISSAA